jgi:hypothetical protein
MIIAGAAPVQNFLSNSKLKQEADVNGLPAFLS